MFDRRKELKKSIKEISLYVEIPEEELEISALKKVMIKEI